MAAKAFGKEAFDVYIIWVMCFERILGYYINLHMSQRLGIGLTRRGKKILTTKRAMSVFVHFGNRLVKFRLDDTHVNWLTQGF